MVSRTFLAHFDSAGATTYIPLGPVDAISTYYLFDTADLGPLVSSKKDHHHPYIELQVAQDYCLLSVYGNRWNPVVVLGDSHVEVPRSDQNHQKSIIITGSQQFLTPTGRYQVAWDRPGNISNSMPPPLLSVPELEVGGHTMDNITFIPVREGHVLVDQLPMGEMADEDDHLPVPVTEIRLSPAPLAGSDEDEESGGNEAKSQTSSSARADKGRTDVDINAEVRDSHHNASAQPQTSASAHATSRDGNDVLSRSTSTKFEAYTKDPLSKKATIEYGTPADDIVVSGEDKTEDHCLDAQVSMDGNHEDESLSAISSGSQMAQQSTESRPVDISLPDDQPNDNGTSDGERTDSEDEAQQQGGVRPAKRRLLEIEDMVSPPPNKKQKISNSVEALSAKRIEDESKQDDTITVVRSLRQEPRRTRKSQPVPNKAEMLIATPVKTMLTHSPNSSLPSVPSSKSSRRPSRQSKTPTPRSARVLDHDKPAVIFSSTSKISKNKKISSIIERLGGTIVFDISKANVLCIGEGKIKKTGRFIIAVTKGIDIVTDDWVKQAHHAHRFPDCRDFLPRDTKHEKEWRFSLSKALENGKQGLELLDGTAVYFTKQLRKDLGDLSKELKQVALAMGATKVYAGTPENGVTDRVLVVGSTKNIDPESSKINRLGHKLYGQDVLTMAVLRGQLELDSAEFVIEVPVKDEPLSSPVKGR